MKLKITARRYLPELILTNEMLSQQVDTSDEWIVSRTGISERRLTQGEPTWYMAVQAARKAIEAASLQPSELDIILVTTCTPDYFVPATACIVQAELGASNAFCFDVNAACTGFIYALDMAARYLQDEQIRHVLIVSSENLSKKRTIRQGKLHPLRSMAPVQLSVRTLKPDGQSRCCRPVWDPKETVHTFL